MYSYYDVNKRENAITLIAAVSTFKTKFPKDAPIQPFSLANLISRGLKSPSGSIKIITEEGLNHGKSL